MAKGSHSGWFGLPKEKRVCAGCGAKLTLAPPKGYEGPLDDWHLVFQDMPSHRVFHSRCFTPYGSLG